MTQVPGREKNVTQGVVSYDVVLDAFDAGWETGKFGPPREASDKWQTSEHVF